MYNCHVFLCHLAQERDGTPRRRLVARLGPGRLEEELLELRVRLIADGEVERFGRDGADLVSVNLSNMANLHAGSGGRAASRRSLPRAV